MTGRSALVAAVMVLLASACSGMPSPDDGGEPERNSSSSLPSAARSSGADEAPDPSGGGRPAGVRFSTWQLGAHPLPLRADGFGTIRPTPPQLRQRRYRTIDRLPRPSTRSFSHRILRIDPQTRRRMGETWQPGCPVTFDQMRRVLVSHWGFDNRRHTGEIVVRADVAPDLVRVFRSLYRDKFPIEEMRLPTTADLNAAPTGDGNNTAGMVCRASRSSNEWSAHALGVAVDINPFMNPYRRDDLVLPERASSYLRRDRPRPGMIRPDDVVVRSFARIGWTWGGDFRSVRDYMHFSLTGR